MMLKIHKSLFFFFLFIVNLEAQLPQRPYQPLIFENLDYRWYDISKDTSIFSFQGDGYNCFKPTYSTGPQALEHNGYIYSVAYRRHLVAIYNGTYIEKRDINSGQLQWRVFYGYTGEDTRVEYARLMYINDDNQLELISQQTPTHIDSIAFNPFYRDGLVLTRRAYNLETGALLLNIQPDKVSKDYFKSDFYFGREITKFYKEPNGIRVFFKSQIKDVNFWAFNYISTVVNPLDKEVVYDTLQSQYDDTDFTYFKMNDSLFLIAEHIDSTKQFVFKYVDGRMKVLSEVIGPKQEDWGFLGSIDFIEYDENTQTFLAKVFDFDVEQGGLTEAIVIIDTKAIVKKRISVPVGYDNLVRVLNWKSGNIKILASKLIIFNAASSALDVLEESEGNGSFTVIRSCKITDQLRAAAISNVLETDDLYIIPLWERSFYFNPNIGGYSLDVYGDAVSMLAVSKDQFILTQTQDIASNSVIIFPNPFESKLLFRCENSRSGNLMIRNTNGSLVFEQKLDEEREFYIDGIFWPSGLYFVSFIDENGHIFTHKVMKL